MGVKPENQFPKNWKFDPQNEDVDDVIERFWSHIQNQHI